MTDTAETLRRWRLVLGGGAADGTGCSLGAQDARIDDTLSALYDAERTGGLGGSSPNVARWLGDIREFFPSRVVQVMQQDAIERLALKRLMLEPEVLESLAPDVNLVATLLSLKNLIPSKTKATARIVVRPPVEGSADVLTRWLDLQWILIQTSAATWGGVVFWTLIDPVLTDARVALLIGAAGFATAIANTYCMRFWPSMLAMLMIEPPPLRIIRRAAARTMARNARSSRRARSPGVWSRST